MNTNLIHARILYWTRRSCPKHAAAWREMLPARIETIPTDGQARTNHINNGGR